MDLAFEKRRKKNALTMGLRVCIVPLEARGDCLVACCFGKKGKGARRDGQEEKGSEEGEEEGWQEEEITIAVCAPEFSGTDFAI